MKVDELVHLQLVQPGSRRGFRRRIVGTLRRHLKAVRATFLLGHGAEEDALTHDESGERELLDLGPLPELFALDIRSLLEVPRHVYLADELYDAGAAVPFFQRYPLEEAHTMLCFLHEASVLFGVLVVERAEAWTKGDKLELESLVPFILAGIRAQMTYESLAREASALRALGKIRGTLAVIDRDRGRVVWAANRRDGVDYRGDIAPVESELVQAATQLLDAKARGEALPTPPTFKLGAVVSVAKIEDDPVFLGANCLVVQIEAAKEADPGALERLSKREREIARLLVAGYSGVNVAAISGLSENTVRTYVRRMYAKLGVSNRADLVRTLMSPESHEHVPASSTAAAADSSLAYGDDTLD